MRRAILFLAVTWTVFLSGCSLYSLVPSGNSQYTIVNERAGIVPEAPIGDRNEDYVERVALYFVSSDRQQLTSISRTLTIHYDDTLFESIIERLLSASISDGVLGVVPNGTRLLGIEESCGIVTVLLSSEAMKATAQELLWMKSAIANSILSASDAQYAHILISGREQGNMSLPTGAVRFTSDTLQALWTKYSGEDERFSLSPNTAGAARDIVVYYPAYSGDYLLAQARRVTFDSYDICGTVIGELGNPPDNNLCLAAFDGDIAPLSVEVIILDDGSRVVKVVFSENLYEALSRTSISVWRLMASMTYTLCRNVPDVDGVIAVIGDEWVFDVSSGGKSAVFRDGIMRPEDFTDAVADVATIYFSSPSAGLTSIGRVLSARDGKSPRAIINELISGPLPGEDCLGLFPSGITHDDILGIRVRDHAALINLSPNFYSRCQNISFDQERNLVYSIVNTLCEMDGVNRVRIFINGKSADTLSDYISIKTELLPNPGLVAAP